MKEIQLSGATLAYLGDAVIEIMVREYIIRLGITDPGKLNAVAKKFVSAKAQSAGVEHILTHLSEEETAVYKRGRNAHGISVPRSATVAEYRRATGLEALFAYLHLSGERERLRELFEITFEEVIGELSHPISKSGAAAKATSAAAEHITERNDQSYHGTEEN